MESEEGAELDERGIHTLGGFFPLKDLVHIFELQLSCRASLLS